MPNCTFEPCGRESRARGLCSGHWKQDRAGVTLSPLRARALPESPVCSIDGCDRPHFAHGYCNSHDSRIRRRGEAAATVPLGSLARKDQPSVGGLHRRLARERGPAREQACIDCGGTAAEWSYNNADPAELIGEDHGVRLAYSLDVANYDPRCRPCHRRFDRQHRKGAAA